MRAPRRASIASAHFLARLDGSCKTPIAGLAEIEDGVVALSRADPHPDGSDWHGSSVTGGPGTPQHRHDAGEELLARAGPEFLVKLA